jgi:hypothetical protein
VPRPLRSAADHALAALVLRRRQLAQLVEAEHNRARRTDEPLVHTSIEAHLSWLEQAVGEFERAIKQRLEASPLWRERATLLATVPGVAKSPWPPCSVFCRSSDSSTAEPSPRWSGSPPSPATAA